MNVRRPHPSQPQTRRTTQRRKHAYRASRRPLDIRTLALTVGTLGFLRPAPGTWGSLPPAGLAFALLLSGVGSSVVTAASLALALVAGVACVVWGRYAERRFKRRDASEVVADETAGGALPFCFLPHAAAEQASLTAVARADEAIGAFLFAATIAAIGFFAFRVFDIAKLQPARNLEGLPGGWGILCDDLMAGVYAAVVVQVATRYIM